MASATSWRTSRSGVGISEPSDRSPPAPRQQRPPSRLSQMSPDRSLRVVDDRGDLGVRAMSPEEDDDRTALVSKGKGRAMEPEELPTVVVEEEEEEARDDPDAEARIQQHLERLAEAERARRRSVRSSGQFVLVPSGPDVDLPALSHGITDLGRKGSQLARRGSKLAREASMRSRARRLGSQGGMEPVDEAVEMSPSSLGRSNSSLSTTLVDSHTSSPPTRARSPPPERASSLDTVASETYEEVPERPKRNWQRLPSQRSTVQEEKPKPRVGLFDWCLCACFVMDEDEEQSGKTMPDL